VSGRVKFEGVDIPDVEYVQLHERDAQVDPANAVAEGYRIAQIDVFCVHKGRPRVMAEGQEGTLSIDAPDTAGMHRIEDWFAIYRSVTRRSFGPGKSPMWLYTFRTAARPAST
jgi:hypothetical protein